MQRNLILYQRALFLRKKKGYSYSEIREEIPIAKSTLSGWLKDIVISEKQQKRIKQKQIEKRMQTHNLGEWNRKCRQDQIRKIRVLAKKNSGKISKRELFIAGIMLYWAEGGKVSKQVSISNSDPAFIKFIMRWFTNCLKIDIKSFYASIHYHQGQNENDLIKFWSQVSSIPIKQFKKGFCKPPGTGHRKHYLQHGTLQIRLKKSCDLLHKILGWKDGLIEDIVSGKHQK